MVNQNYNPNDAISTPRYVSGTPDWVKPIIDQAAQTHNVPPVLLSALLKQESGFNPRAQSSAGAQGIAQFMPATARGRGVNPWDPMSAIMGAAKYLADGLLRYRGDISKALAAYNAGFGAVDRYQGVPPYKETQHYVKNIMSMVGDIHQTYAAPTLEMAKQAAGSSQSPQNLPAQVRSILNMSPEQAQAYRQQVNQTVPQLLPQNAPNVFAPFPVLGQIPQLKPYGKAITAGFVNAIPGAVAGGARLPAARSIGEAGRDLFDIGTGALQGASFVGLGRNVASAVSNANPSWFTNQRGGSFDHNQFNTDIDAMSSSPISGDRLNLSPSFDRVKAMAVPPQYQFKSNLGSNVSDISEFNAGWPAGIKSQFDYALLTKNAPVLKQLLPLAPPNYIRSIAPQVNQVLGAVL